MLRQDREAGRGLFEAFAMTLTLLGLYIWIMVWDIEAVLTCLSALSGVAVEADAADSVRRANAA